MASIAVQPDVATLPTSPWSCRSGLISDLLVRCGRGDEAAFARLLDIFYAAVRAATASIVAPQDLDEAVCAAFVSLWRNAPNFRPGHESAVAWVMSGGHLPEPTIAERQQPQRHLT